MNTNPNTRPMLTLAAAGVLAWALAGCSGSTNLVTPTIAPVTLAVPTTAPPTVPPPTAPPTQPVPDNETTAPPTAAPENPDPPVDPGVRYELRDVPQLGSEPVRGSGCGLDGSLGESMADGWWYGLATNWGDSGFSFDLACVYFGDAALPFIDECLAGPDGEFCEDRGSPEFWVENRSQRLRTVPIDPNIEVVVEGGANCPDASGRDGGMLSAIQVVQGRAVYLVTSCPAG